MALQHHHAGWVIWVSFLVAFMLTTLPLPDWAAPLRPAWVLLALVYWCMALPQRVGVGVGWLVGLALDALTGALLGQNALGLALVAYFTIRLHQRLRIFPLWQQALSVMVLVATYQVFVFWVKGLTGHPPATLAYWLPTLSSALLWPWVLVLLRELRLRFRVA
jgi:rod shape-determining protein MreD